MLKNKKNDEAEPPSSPVSPPPCAWSGTLAKGDVPLCRVIAQHVGGPYIQDLV